jgi:flagellar hook-basal body complex protein FliE
MIINVARLQSAAQSLPLQATRPEHFGAAQGGLPIGTKIADAGNEVGAIRRGSFQDAMFRALDTVSSDQFQANSMIERAITEPGSVDIHDVTIAQARASMSLNVTRTILNRAVQSWKDILNTR